MNVIDQIENQGITISFYDGKIKLEPVEKVTPEIVAEVRSNRAQILDALNNRTNMGAAKKKNNVDMAACPDGKWWTPKLMDTAKANTVQPTRCFCCGGQTFWRKKDNAGGRWICDVCHPPALSKDEIERLQ